MDVLTSRFGKGNQNASSWLCCEAIDQIFDCGCVLTEKCYANLHLLTNLNKEITIGLKVSLKATENVRIASITFILPQDIAFQG